MRPSFLDNMSYAMSEVYGEVVDRLLVNLAHHFQFYQGSGTLPKSFEYQARKLAELGQVHRESVDIIMGSLQGADAALRQTLEAAIVDALAPVEPQLRKAAKAGMLNGPGFLPPEVVPSQMQAFKAYYAQSADKLNLVNTVMLESTEQAYRATVTDIVTRIDNTQKILNSETGEVIVGVESWNSAMHKAVGRMVENGLTGFIDHGGHMWSPETYVAMDIRTTVFNTAREAVWERNDQYGNDLYQVSSHNAARPLCYPWQGKVISRTGMSRDVIDLYGETVHVYAQSETTYGEPAGLFGINCKHYPMPFVPGISTIRQPPMDEDENAKAYEDSQKQRQLERKLRKEKLDLNILKAQGADEDLIRQQREKVRAASADIDDFCEATNRTRRRSREYTPVLATYGPEVREESRKEGSSDTSVKWTTLDSKEYRESISRVPNMTSDGESAVNTRIRWMLDHRDGTTSEDLYSVNLKTGKEIARITSQNHDSGVERVPSVDRRLKEADSPDQLIFHNHPRSSPPSTTDLNELLKTPKSAGMTVGHNGSLYYYTAPSRIIESSDYLVALSHFPEYNGHARIEKAIERLAEEYDFDFIVIRR